MTETEEPQPASEPELTEPPFTKDRGPVDNVLLIDGDNDPHMPPEFPITQYSLVRVFLRPGAKMPRGLERRVGHLPMCVIVVSPKGGANAADFVMSLHAGMLHSILPMQIPFTMVTFDKSIQAMAQELQRLGRQAYLWTSHPEGGRGRAAKAEGGTSSPAPRARRASRRGGSGRRRGAGRAAAKPAAPAAPPSPAASRGDKDLLSVAASYAARLHRIKDPPSRLKTLLNDIKNRASAGGFLPEEILEELKARHGVHVDDSGRVRVAKGGAESPAS